MLFIEQKLPHHDETGREPDSDRKEETKEMEQKGKMIKMITMFMSTFFEGNVIFFSKKAEAFNRARLSNCLWMKFLFQSKQTKDRNGEKDRMNEFCPRKIVVRDGLVEELTEMSAESRHENAVRVWIPD
jgi:hypothetical protein